MIWLTLWYGDTRKSRSRAHQCGGLADKAAILCQLFSDYDDEYDDDVDNDNDDNADDHNANLYIPLPLPPSWWRNPAICAGRVEMLGSRILGYQGFRISGVKQMQEIRRDQEFEEVPPGHVQVTRLPREHLAQVMVKKGGTLRHSWDWRQFIIIPWPFHNVNNIRNI